MDRSEIPAAPSSLSPLRKRLQGPLLALALLGIAGAALAIRAGWIALAQDTRPGGTAVHRAFRPAAPPFDTSNATIPREQIHSGGPPKDGIPALTQPKFVAADEAEFMQPTDQVIGVALGDEAKAFPLKILDYHEAVNDQVGGVPVAVTYCPLCDSSAVYDRRHGDALREFGISGLLYNSNVLLYDRQSDTAQESLWSQMRSQAVAGSSVDQRLKKLPLEVTTWAAWQARYPQTTILSADTGYPRNYNRTVYRGYFASPQLMFPVEPLDERLPAKTPVVGVSAGDAHRAYPLNAFANEPTRIEQTLADRFFAVVYDPQSQSVRIEQAAEGVEWMYAFWFAWSAFHPQTEVWTR